MQTVINKEYRTISTILSVGGDIHLELATHHNKERKCFTVFLSRVEIKDGFKRVSIMEDTQIIRQLPVSRYSAKRMEEEHKSFQFLLDDSDWINWAKEKTQC